MSESYEIWRALMGRRDDRSGIDDPELDDIRGRIKSQPVQTLRSGIDQIDSLPTKGRPDGEARRKAELEWLSRLLRTMGAPQPAG
jgi:hypothetical protein